MISAIAALLFLWGSGADEPTSAAAPISEERQRILDRELAGKAPQAGERCISTRTVHRMHVISDDMLLFRVSGSLVYVNRLRQPCPGLARTAYAPRIAASGSRYCSGDIAETEADGGSSCQIGDFTPYRTSTTD